MRPINKIIIHCSATPEGRAVSISEIRRLHIQQNGWNNIGYHYVVELDGTVKPGRTEAEIGAHCQGHNADSIGICYIGGVAKDGKTPKDTRTPAQRQALRDLVDKLRQRYLKATLHGHCEFAAKACPSFNVHTQW